MSPSTSLNAPNERGGRTNERLQTQVRSVGRASRRRSRRRRSPCPQEPRQFRRPWRGRSTRARCTVSLTPPSPPPGRRSSCWRSAPGRGDRSLRPCAGTTSTSRIGRPRSRAPWRSTSRATSPKSQRRPGPSASLTERPRFRYAPRTPGKPSRRAPARRTGLRSEQFHLRRPARTAVEPPLDLKRVRSTSQACGCLRTLTRLEEQLRELALAGRNRRSDRCGDPRPQHPGHDPRHLRPRHARGSGAGRRADHRSPAPSPVRATESGDHLVTIRGHQRPILDDTRRAAMSRKPLRNGLLRHQALRNETATLEFESRPSQVENLATPEFSSEVGRANGSRAARVRSPARRKRSRRGRRRTYRPASSRRTGCVFG
jgi:hypothetical protein